MPYNENTGRITAPVSVDDVRRALGIGLDEPGALDVGTLCCASNVNPYSLIRPTFFLDTAGTRPRDFIPSFFQNEHSIASLAPLSQRNALTAGGKCSSLAIAAEYNGWSGSGNNYWYAAKRWGYIVPYVNNVANIPAFVNLRWLTFTPKDAEWTDNGNGTRIQSETWCVLDQFDGYLHSASPVDPMGNSRLEYGEPVHYTGIVPTGKWKPADILGTSDTGHSGGVLSAAAVFGDFNTKEYHYGASLYTRDSASGKFALSRIALDALRIGATTSTGDTILQDTYLGALKGCHEAMLIPWVLEGKAHVENNVLVSDQSAPLLFYPLTFGDGLGFLRAIVEPKLVKVTEISWYQPDVTKLKRYRISVTFYNGHGRNYPLTVQNFAIYANTRAVAAGKRCTFVSPSAWGVTEVVESSGPLGHNLGYVTLTATIDIPSSEESLSQVLLTFTCGDDNHSTRFATPMSAYSLGSGLLPDHTVNDTVVPAS